MTPYRERAEQVQLRLMRELDIDLEGALIPSETIISDAIRAAVLEETTKLREALEQLYSFFDDQMWMVGPEQRKLIEKALGTEAPNG